MEKEDPVVSSLIVYLIATVGIPIAIMSALCAISAGFSSSSAMKRGSKGFAVVWGIATIVCATYAIRTALAVRRVFSETKPK